MGRYNFMTKAAFIFGALLFLTSCEQQGEQLEVPEEVQAAFMAQYPNATSIVWQQDEGAFEASFQTGAANGNTVKVKYSVEGRILEINE